MSTTAAGSAFVRTFKNPQGAISRQEFKARAGHYDHLWQLYTNAKFESAAEWEYYRSRHRLYRNTRSIYNPTRRLVDFYAGIIYPGVLAIDPEDLPPLTQIAIPLPQRTPPEIQAALGQLWQWSNFQAGKSLYARWGAALGNAAIEIADDLDSGKVRLELIWPGHVADLEIDAVGNVKAYAIEYEAWDRNQKQAYVYRRTVDQAQINTYRDGEPASYDGQPASYANPYGFAPLVWCPHTHTGGDHGDPAMRNIGKFDEANSLASQLNDYLRKIMAAPVIVAGGNSLAPLYGQAKRASTADLIQEDQEALAVLQGPQGSEISALRPEGAADVIAALDKVIQEIEDDHPELNLYKDLRAMSHVTGPGAERMLGDAKAYIDDARTNYDTQLVKVAQMAMAIGGYRARSGAWGRSLTDQQRSFAEFDLESYAAGDLDFDILPRPIIPETPIEALQRQQLAQALDADRAALAGDTSAIEARIQAQASA